MTAPCPLAVQLYTFRDEMAKDPAAVLARVAEMGCAGVEVLSPAGLPAQLRDVVAGWTVDAVEMRRMLDELGLTVCSAHSALPEAHNVSAVLDEQEVLGNDLLIVSVLSALPGGRNDDLDRLETLKRTAERFNQAASLAAGRGMRVGYHNHSWEWKSLINGRPGWDVFWEYLDPSVVAEVDLYWAQVAGQDPGKVVADLGPRAQLVHIKDGPLVVGEPMTAVGDGRAEVAPALVVGEHVRWHIIELDECATDIFDAVQRSIDWLVAQGFSMSASTAPKASDLRLDASRGR